MEKEGRGKVKIPSIKKGKTDEEENGKFFNYYPSKQASKQARRRENDDSCDVFVVFFCTLGGEKMTFGGSWRSFVSHALYAREIKLKRKM